MVTAKSTDRDFIDLIETIGPHGTAKRLGASIRGVYGRRANLEKKLGRQIKSPEHTKGGLKTRVGAEHPGRLEIEIKNGIVLVGSDAHYRPDQPPTVAHRAFVNFSRKLEPVAIIMNGDVIDGATVSRHPPMGWESLPTLAEEIEEAQNRLHEIVMAAPKAAKLYWSLGNHDARLETRIATVAPELAKLKGVHLHDHFDSRWQSCWSVWINDDVVVKHRHKTGVHAVHNSTMWAGKTMVTGHLHSLRVTPLTDYNGTRYGVDCGCLAEPYGTQFAYLEDNPRSWRSGFVVLTFRDGRLMWPEIVHVLNEDSFEFRGEIIKI